MRFFLAIFLIMQITYCVGQNFNLKYNWVGLGSNAKWSIVEDDDECDLFSSIEIADTFLYYSVCARIYTIDEKNNDTIWANKRMIERLPFRKSSIDSIIAFIDTLKGKSLYNSNPGVMSGGIHNFIIEGQDWCTNFQLKNTFDSTALEITNVINSYLEEKIRIYVPYNLWEGDKYKIPIIEDCPLETDGSYREVLEKDYHLIRKN